MPRLWFMLIIVVSWSVQASDYVVDKQKSSIVFAGSYDGDVFEGQFTRWTMDIALSRNNIGGSHFSAIFYTRSAKTGRVLYNTTLPQKGWFYSQKYPKAVFNSTAVRALGPHSLTVIGDLMIRGRTQQVSFLVELDESSPDNNHDLVMKGTFDIDRLAYHIGREADEDAEWVSRKIAITFNVVMTKK